MILNKECTSTELAGLLDITKRQVRNLAQKEVVKRLDRGSYDTRASIAGYIQYLNDQIPNKSVSGEEAKSYRLRAEQERIKLLKHKAELARLEEEEKKGLLVSAADEHREMSRVAIVVKNAVLALPARLSQPFASESDSNKIYRMLESELIQTLTELADLIGSGEDLRLEELSMLDQEADCFHWGILQFEQEELH